MTNILVLLESILVGVDYLLRNVPELVISVRIDKVTKKQ